jgi:hypothetical protein
MRTRLASSRRTEQQQMPPMAYVEEISLEEAMNSQPSWEQGKEGMLLPGDTLRSLITESSKDFFPPCIVEDKIPSDGTTGTEENGTSAARDSTTGTKDPPPMSTNAAWDSEAKAPDDGGGIEQPTFFEIAHLPLVFELRSLMDDQVFRLAGMDQRLDMLFVAHSKNLC